MTELLRRDYLAPKIHTAVAQILLDWDVPTLDSFGRAIHSQAFDQFVGVTKSVQQHFNMTVTGNVPQLIPRPVNGTEIVADENGSKIILDPTGILVTLAGPYRGREYLFSLVEWVVSRLQDASPGTLAKRVSTLYESHITPTTQQYAIEDYIVPKFEVSDPRLNAFDSFQHQVFLNLSAIQPGPFQCRLVIANTLDKTGIAVIVDVLDNRVTPLREVMDRLKLVKDLETHVFETTITEKTREQYGVIQ